MAARAFDREGASEVAQVAHELRAAARSLLHHGSSEQLAEGQRLLEQTRRALYLILASERQTEAASTPVEALAGPTVESAPAPEVDENPET